MKCYPGPSEHKAGLVTATFGRIRLKWMGAQGEDRVWTDLSQ